MFLSHQLTQKVFYNNTMIANVINLRRYSAEHTVTGGQLIVLRLTHSDHGPV